MSIVIIEGPDLSGKSYAIEKIGKHFNSGFILKNCYKPKDITDSKKIYAQYWKILSLSINYSKQNLVILDRFYPSQAVYSVLRGRDEFEHNEIIAIENYLKLMDGKIIYLDTPWLELKERYEKRGDEHIKKLETLKKIRERYNAFMALSKLPILYLNTMKKEEDWIKEVEEFINE